MSIIIMVRLWQWARYATPSYEVSSRGDRRFSALYARLRDGRTIEEAYQLDVKGYRAKSNDWHVGKGKPSLNGKSRDELWIDYLALWTRWGDENPELIADLYQASQDTRMLTDRFATSEISQARALATLLNVVRLAREDNAQT